MAFTSRKNQGTDHQSVASRLASMVIHPGAAGKRKTTAARYAWLLKKFAGVGCKTATEPFLLELGRLSFEDRWQQSALRFWNQLVALPEDDLYRDVLFDSVATRTGFARGCIKVHSITSMLGT